MSFKKLLYIVFALASFGCVEHYSMNDFDLYSLTKAKIALSSAATDEFGYIEKENWPDTIKSLDPLSVRKTIDGIYIQLDESWVEESGLFLPFKGVKMNNNSDPNFKQLDQNVYSYHIKG